MRVVIIWMCALATPVHAEDAAWTRPHVVTAAHLSAAGPFGDAGLELELVPVPWFSVAIGGGSARALPLANGGSYAIAAAIRGRYPLGAGWSMHVSAGYSRSDWTWSDHPFGESPYSATQWSSVSHMDLDVGIEHHWRHFVVRMYLGTSAVTRERGYSCQVLRSDGSCSPPVTPQGSPYTGVALGYAFSL